MDTVLKTAIKIGTSRVLCAVLLLNLLVLLNGCDPYADRYPLTKHSEWVCEDPIIVLKYTITDDGCIITEANLTIDDEQVPIEINMRGDIFDIFGINDVEGVNAPNNILMHGEWRYSRGKLILEIERDNLFDGKYKVLEFEGSGDPVR